jgi:hypothetical protein
MPDTKGSEAVGAAQVARVNGTRFLDPDSALVRAALDLLATHAVDGAEGAPERCGHCRMSYPCPTVQHARQVVNAGGMTRTPEATPVGGGVPDRVGVATSSAAVGRDAVGRDAVGRDAVGRDADDEVPSVTRDPVGAV